MIVDYNGYALIELTRGVYSNMPLEEPKAFENDTFEVLLYTDKYGKQHEVFRTNIGDIEVEAKYDVEFFGRPGAEEYHEYLEKLYRFLEGLAKIAREKGAKKVVAEMTISVYVFEYPDGRTMAITPEGVRE